MLSAISHFQNEITFSIASEDDLIKIFRFKDQKKVILPLNLRFPLHVRSYFTWKESSGVYVYLVFKKPNWDLPRGMVFKKIERGSEPTGRLCSWCNSYGSQDEIGMLSVKMNHETSSGYILCNDLSCIEKLEDAAGLSGKNFEKWAHQLYERIGNFFEGVSQFKPDEE